MPGDAPGPSDQERGIKNALSGRRAAKLLSLSDIAPLRAR